MGWGQYCGAILNLPALISNTNSWVSQKTSYLKNKLFQQEAQTGEARVGVDVFTPTHCVCETEMYCTVSRLA